MTLITQYLFPDKGKVHKKDIYTYNVAVIIAIVSIVIYVGQAIFIFASEGFFLNGDEYRLLFIPLLSALTLFLLKNEQTGLAKTLLILGSVFLFSYYSFFFGNITRETILLNPIILIVFSVFTSFIIKYKIEKYYYLFVGGVLFVLLIFFNEIISVLSPEMTYEDIAKGDLFVVRLAYLIIFFALNIIIYISVKLNSRIQNELDIQNRELDDSRSNLLNQNIQLKQFQDEILNQNEELKAFTEELQSKNELIASKNQQLNVSYTYTKAIKDLLKNDKSIFNQYFSEYFICGKSVAHVSSNLFWAKRTEKKLFFVLGDANGNFASSSIFSVLVLKILNYIFNSNIDIKDLFEGVYNEINRVNKEYSVRRFSPEKLLNLTLCSFDISTKELEMISVNQRIYIRKGKELIEKKSSVKEGLSISDRYTIEKLILETEDVLYLFTNSCANQLGANGVGKLSFSRFKKAIQGVASFPFNIQEEKLRNFMSDWRGNEPQKENMKFVAIKID